ncbi:hypothetical protein chiPu_0032647, partial [Chiloscyllium punctatum]|nr:hypothetical protein [Chiloscyllium punctatum]
MFTCAVSPLFDHAGRLAGAVNISSCRSDLGRSAHELALAVTTEATRRIEQSFFRRRYRASWIATLPDDGHGMLAYDDDRRVVGACRTARGMFGLTDAMIDDGIDLSHLIQLDDRATRAADDPVTLRRADGTPWGRGRLAPPVRVRSPRPMPAPP